MMKSKWYLVVMVLLLPVLGGVLSGHAACQPGDADR